MLSGTTHDRSPLQIPMQAQVGFPTQACGVDTQWYEGGRVWKVAQSNPVGAAVVPDLHMSHEATSEQSSTFTQPPE